MLTHQTAEKLRGLRLHGMARALTEQAARPDVQDLSFEERLGLLVDTEWTDRDDRRLKRLLREARLRINACTEDIDYRAPRGLDKEMMARLGGCDWIRRGQNVLITGPTGAGKTFIACALGNAACRHGLKTRYFRIPRLLHELALAKGDGTYPKLMKQLVKTDLLILDDWGLAVLGAADARELLEVIEDRSDHRSTLVASQLPLEHWHGAFEDPSVADAILDRLIHHAHKIILKGESMRKVLGDRQQTDHQEVV